MTAVNADHLALGMITPPFGMNLFAACTVARVSLDRIVHHLIPFVLVILACLMVITFVAQLSLALRDLLYAKLNPLKARRCSATLKSVRREFSQRKPPKAHAPPPMVD